MGRYQKRELNKNVRSYSDKDLSAILGVQFTPVVWTPDEPEPEVRAASRSTSHLHSSATPPALDGERVRSARHMHTMAKTGSLGCSGEGQPA